MAVPTDGNDDSDYSDHPDLSGIAGEMRAEWRAEQESATADAAAQLRHGRGLTDWLRDRMHAGDRVAAFLTAQSFVGVVEEVGDDLVALRGPFGRVEIHVCDAVPISFELVEHPTSGGARSVVRRTFRDALLPRDEQPRVRVGTVLEPGGIEGALSVARDFVSVVSAAGIETIIPIAHVSWVVPLRP
jgi:hypothetical protein